MIYVKQFTPKVTLLHEPIRILRKSFEGVRIKSISLHSHCYANNLSGVQSRHVMPKFHRAKPNLLHKSSAWIALRCQTSHRAVKFVAEITSMTYNQAETNYHESRVHNPHLSTQYFPLLENSDHMNKYTSDAFMDAGD